MKKNIFFTPKHLFRIGLTGIFLLIVPTFLSAQGLMERRVLLSEARTHVVYESRIETTPNWGISLISGNPSWIWRSRKGDSPPFVFIYRLGASAWIHMLSFTNSLNEDKVQGVSAREVEVEFSETGPYSGYVLIGKYHLKKGTDTQEIEIPRSRAVWVRLTIHSNYGHPVYTELGEFEAWGKFDFPLILILSYFIGIIGMAITLAAFSRHEYIANRVNVSLQETMRWPAFRNSIRLGIMLIFTGLALYAVGPIARFPVLIIFIAAGGIACYHFFMSPQTRKKRV